jgi:hypothetical protein
MHTFPNIGLDKTKFKFLHGMLYAVLCCLNSYSLARYWVKDEHSHKYNLFLDFAEDNGFDPLVPENWYVITSTDVFAYKVCFIHLQAYCVLKTWFQHAREMICYKHNFTDSLMAVFPNIGLERSRMPSDDKLIWQPSMLKYAQNHIILIYFILIPENNWLDPDNQRNVFVKFATQKGFDPLVAENWYDITFKNMRNMKACLCICVLCCKSSVLQNIQNNFPCELVFTQSSSIVFLLYTQCKVQIFFNIIFLIFYIYT